MKTANVERLKAEYRGVMLKGEWFSAKFTKLTEIYDSLKVGDLVEYEAGGGQKGNGLKHLKKIGESLPKKIPNKVQVSEEAKLMKECTDECMGIYLTLPEKIQDKIDLSSHINTLFNRRAR